MADHWRGDCVMTTCQGLMMSEDWTPVAPGYVVLGLGASPWVLFYNSALKLITNPPWTTPSAAVYVVEFSPDGRLLVIATLTAIYRYDMTSGVPVYLGAMTSPPAWGEINTISFSADSSRMSVSDYGTSPWAWVYNTSTWATVTAPTGAGTYTCDFDGTASAHVAECYNASAPILKLFDTPGMGASATQPGGIPSNVGALIFSPAGDYLAVNGGASPSPFRI